MATPLLPPPPTGASRLVFTSSQAATYLGVSLATIRRWTDAGHIGCYRTPGGQRRFSREQLDGFIASMQRRTAHRCKRPPASRASSQLASRPNFSRRRR